MRFTRRLMRWFMRKFAPACYRENLSFIAVDTETTGLDPALCGITEIGWTLVERGRIVSTTSMLVMPSSSLALVDDDDMCRENLRRSADGAESVDEALLAIRRAAEALRGRIGERPMLAFHNAPFDVGFITGDRASGRNTIRWLFQESAGPFSRRLLDTQAMVQPLVLSGELKSQSLKRVCELLGVKPGDHRAAGDSRATAECVIELLTGGWV